MQSNSDFPYSRMSSIQKFEIRIIIRHRVESSRWNAYHSTARTIRIANRKRMRKGHAWKSLSANLLLSVVREVVPFYRPDTDGEIFVTEKSSATQISTRSCRSIRFAGSARRQRVDTRSLSVGFLSAFRERGWKRARARKTRLARQLSRAPISLFLSLVFTRFLVFRAFSNEAWIHELGSTWCTVCTRLDVTGYRW